MDSTAACILCVFSTDDFSFKMSDQPTLLNLENSTCHRLYNGGHNFFLLLFFKKGDPKFCSPTVLSISECRSDRFWQQNLTRFWLYLRSVQPHAHNRCLPSMFFVDTLALNKFRSSMMPAIHNLQRIHQQYTACMYNLS